MYEREFIVLTFAIQVLYTFHSKILFHGFILGSPSKLFKPKCKIVFQIVICMCAHKGRGLQCWEKHTREFLEFTAYKNL